MSALHTASFSDMEEVARDTLVRTLCKQSSLRYLVACKRALLESLAVAGLLDEQWETVPKKAVFYAI